MRVACVISEGGMYDGEGGVCDGEGGVCDW